MRSPASLLVPVVLLLLAVGSSGCGGRLMTYRCPSTASDASVDPHELWGCHREIVDRAVRGKRFGLRELREAVAFFETLTGIEGELEGTGFGPIPSTRFERSVERWDAWYAEHRDRLRWDAVAGRVVVDET